MPTSSFGKFNIFVQDLGQKVHNLNADALKWMFTNVLPVATNAVKADITEIGAGNGYSTGGIAASGVSFAQTAGIGKLIANAASITAAGGAIATFRYIVLYNSTPVAGPLIGWYDYGGPVVVNDGETFKIAKDAAGNAWDATTPILTLQ